MSADVEVGITVSGKLYIGLVPLNWEHLNRAQAESLHARIGEVIRKMPGSATERVNPHLALEAFWALHGPRFTELLHGVIDGGGRTGLKQGEFFESLRLLDYVSGMMAVLGQPAADWISEQIRQETERYKSPLTPAP